MAERFPNPALLLDCIGKSIEEPSVRELITEFDMEQTDLFQGAGHITTPDETIEISIRQEDKITCKGVFWKVLSNGSFIESMPLPPPYSPAMSLSEARSKLGRSVSYKPAATIPYIGYASARLIKDEDGLRHTIEFERDRISQLFVGEFEAA